MYMSNGATEASEFSAFPERQRFSCERVGWGPEWDYSRNKVRIHYDYDRKEWRSGRVGRVRICGECNKPGIFIGPQKRCDACRQVWLELARDKERGYFAAQKRAHAAVFKAIRNGLIAPLDGDIACVDCAKPAQVYDHRDYAKPLDVVPVCLSCNKKRGNAAWAP